MKPFIISLIIRFGTENPRVFKAIQLTSIGLGAVSAAFAYLDQEHLLLPHWMCWLEHDAVWISTVLIAALAQLPNKPK